jgi:hypothetical protein
MNTRYYSELEHLETFDERFEYLALNGFVGATTFGFDRHINQQFYKSREWQDVRNYVINRDYGCDLGVPGYEIHIELVVHHINPMTSDDIAHSESWILDPEFLITTTKDTHNAIHYGSKPRAQNQFAARAAGDTNLWQPTTNRERSS